MRDESDLEAGRGPTSQGHVDASRKEKGRSDEELLGDLYAVGEVRERFECDGERFASHARQLSMPQARFLGVLCSVCESQFVRMRSYSSPKMSAKCSHVRYRTFFPVSHRQAGQEHE